jgi:hypothetical protein
MQYYLYPLNSLDELQAALDLGCEQLTLIDATPQNGRQAVLTQVNGSNALLVQYAQDYFSLTNYALLYEINEADPCEATNK